MTTASESAPILPPSSAPPPASAPSAPPTRSRVAAAARWVLPALLAAAVLTGIALRTHHLAEPRRNTFDEDHFWKNAQRMLEGKPDRNDHPPLGKMVLMPSMAALGNTEVGRRLPPCLIGILAIGLAGWAGRRLFPGLRGAAGLAAALVALDGFFVAYSRCSLLDGMLAALLFALLAVAANLERPRDYAVAGLLLGLAMSIKWSGVTFLAPLLVGLLFAGSWRKAWPLLLAPAVYLAIFACGLWLGGIDPTPETILAKHRSLASGHLAQHGMRHHAASYWWTWLWMDNPIVLRKDVVAGGKLAILSTMGNPLFWWTSTLAVLGSAVALGAALVSRIRRAVPAAPAATAVGRDLREFFGTHRRGAALLLAAWAAPFAPWVLTERDSYIYHYLPSYGAALLLLAGLAAALLRRRPKTATAAILLGIAAVVYFAPMMQAWPITPEAFRDRLWLPRWR
jgi:dolichyl-phosphate-mannose-protein mannosyltransferase